MKLKLAILLVTLSGFISLSYEILWFRIYSFSVSGAAYGFALLLWAYLSGLALGSRVARKFCRDDSARDPAQLATLGLFVLGANMGGYVSIPLVAWMTTLDVHYVVPLVPVAVVSGLLGAQLPLISHYGIAPDERAGARLSFLYGANIVGSVAGSLLTGFWLLDIWSIDVITTVLTLLGVVSAVLIYAVARPSRRQLVALASLAAFVCVSVVSTRAPLFEHLWEQLQYGEDYQATAAFKHVVENKSGVITVDQKDWVYGGAIYDGEFSLDLTDDTNMLVRPISLGLFHPKPREVLVIGLASGSWASVLVNHPDVEKMTVVEINPGYLELIPKYQPHAKLLEDPRVEIIIDDGRRWLNRHPNKRFDAIIANTTFHWRAQASNLLSREWFEMVDQHLEPGGVYLFNPTDSARAARTAFEVFPHTTRVVNNLWCSKTPFDYDPSRWLEQLAEYTLWGEPLLDLQTEAGRQTLARMEALADSIDDDDDPRAYWRIENSQSLEARVADERIITDDNMGSEWTAFVEEGGTIN